MPGGLLSVHLFLLIFFHLLPLSSVNVLPNVFIHILALFRLRSVRRRQAQRLEAALDACGLSFLVLSLLSGFTSFLGRLRFLLALLVSFSNHGLLLLFKSLALRFFLLDFSRITCVNLYLVEKSQAGAFRLVAANAWQGRANRGETAGA